MNSNSTCPFCNPQINSQLVAKKGTVFAIRDIYPVTEGHILVIPFRHIPDYFTMTLHEQQDAGYLLKLLRDKILLEDNTVEGFNIGINCGAAAGQTILHVHIHLIPRRIGDTPLPRGGVRGVIPGKMSY